MLIKKCSKCKNYTLKEICPKCSEKSKIAHPPKFSLEKERKYGKYKIAKT